MEIKFYFCVQFVCPALFNCGDYGYRKITRGHLQIISLIKEYENTVELPRQRRCISNMTHEFRSLYNTIICDYNKGEYTETYDAGVTEVVADSKRWSLRIKECPPAYATFIKDPWITIHAIMRTWPDIGLISWPLLKTTKYFR